ncbi:MAG: hypothetical protein JST08_03550 [Actinobacteria bacterium]|nr:hypothetical protein [Actinomycetota bacterium]
MELPVRQRRLLVLPATCAAAAIAAVLTAGASSAPAAAEKEIRCPAPSTLVRPADPRGAIPAAKDALGSPGRVLEVRRGPHSTYAGPVRRACGQEVLDLSIYVNVHPIGMRCSACNLHAYVVRHRTGRWEVWTAY